LDLWQTAKPFLERWMDERVGMRAFIKGIRRNIPLWAENLPDFPMLVYEAVNQHQTQAEHLNQINRELKQLRADMQQRHKHITLLLIGGLLVITASISLSIHNETFLDINRNWIELMLGSVGSIMLLLAWITAR
jgi:ubiquinone biosynthesis protein